MTILSAILCRAFGHRPYEHPHIAWRSIGDWLTGFAPHGTPVMVKRCKRCHAKLGERPVRRDEEVIEA